MQVLFEALLNTNGLELAAVILAISYSSQFARISSAGLQPFSPPDCIASYSFQSSFILNLCSKSFT